MTTNLVRGAVLAAVFAAALAAGCKAKERVVIEADSGQQGAAAEPAGDANSPTATSEPAANEPAADALPPTSADAIPPAPAARAGAKPAIASADGDKPGTRVEVTELRRGSGDTLTLKFAMFNDGAKSCCGSCDFRETGGEGCGPITGVHLIDATNKKKYFVIRDSGGKGLCSKIEYDLKPGERLNLWAKFPAPPSDVKAISVVVPLFQPLDDVPIS